MHLNVIQLAESLGVEETVVESWIRNDGLPHFKDAGRLWFDRAQVVAWAAERGLAARAGFLAPAASAGTALSLENLLRAGGVWRDVEPAGLMSLLERILGGVSVLTAPVKQILVERMRSPGGITWAPIGKGVALPHLRSHAALGRDAGFIAMIFLKQPLVLPEPPTDGVPITRLLFFAAPSPRAHLQVLAGLSRALTAGPLLADMNAGAADQDLMAALAWQREEQPRGKL